MMVSSDFATGEQERPALAPGDPETRTKSYHTMHSESYPQCGASTLTLNLDNQREKVTIARDCMQLTSYTDYSLRVLMYLGVKGEQLSSIAEIAQQYNISRNHLMKVVHKLAQEGFVRSQRGRKGGITLGCPPSAISVGDVVRRMEGNLPLVECFRRATNHCPITPVCQLSGILAEARTNFLSTLDQYTLADLLTNQQRLARLFSLPSGNVTASKRSRLRARRAPSSLGTSTVNATA